MLRVTAEDEMIEDEDDGAWVPVTHPDQYHGVVEAPGGRRWWVVPRLHRGAGWAVEVRDGAPDGAVTSRSWYATSPAARSTVDRLRTEIATQGVAPSALTVEAPPADRGLMVVHGYRGWSGEGSHETAKIGVDIGPLSVCDHAWLPTGPHVVCWESAGGVGRYTSTVMVQPRRAIHVHPPFWRRSDGDVKPPPWYHLCRLRRWEYEADAIPAALVLRADGTPRHR